MPDLKPLNRKAYGSIPHLPGSRLGLGDHSVNAGQERICLVKPKEPETTIIVQEKLDGSCVSVAKIDGICVPLIRAGYKAVGSKYKQHKIFDIWAMRNIDRFSAVLNEGERIIGEWILQAHGTRYKAPHEPFVAFDIIKPFTEYNSLGVLYNSEERLKYDDFINRLGDSFVTPRLIHKSDQSFPLQKIQESIRDASRHGAIDEIEGVVFRIESPKKVLFLAKWVRPDKIDGCFLPEVTGQEAVWNYEIDSII